MEDQAHAWKLRSGTLDLSRGALIGIVNVTPDSFSDGGRYENPDRAIAHGMSLWDQGSALVDVGGESTRPGAEPVPAEVELSRVQPVVEGLVDEGVRVSIDTSKPEVAEAALTAGAEVVNDVTACGSPGMAELVRDSGSGVVLMDMNGTTRDTDDVVSDVRAFLQGSAERVIGLGVDASRVAIDPGIGFGKTAEHNLAVLRDLAPLVQLNFPVVLGTSRKRFLGTITGATSEQDKDLATAVTTAMGFLNGARAFRVHNVVMSRRALALAAAIVAPH